MTRSLLFLQAGNTVVQSFSLAEFSPKASIVYKKLYGRQYLPAWPEKKIDKWKDM
jgi:hypothetical protein